MMRPTHKDTATGRFFRKGPRGSYRNNGWQYRWTEVIRKRFLFWSYWGLTNNVFNDWETCFEELKPDEEFIDENGTSWPDARHKRFWSAVTTFVFGMSMFTAGALFDQCLWPIIKLCLGAGID